MNNAATAAEPSQFAARWTTEAGEQRGTTFGGTMCWFPVKPWRLKVKGADFEHIIPCRGCPGCLELARRRLSERLAHWYQGRRSALFLVRVWAAQNRAALLVRNLHRRGTLELEPGLYRLGAGSVGLLSRERARVAAVLRRMGLTFRIEPIRIRRGKRAWRAVTAGLLVSRQVYGEQVKRWYARGLPPLEKKRWEVIKIDAYKSYDRWRSPRARAGGSLLLVPPEVWKMRRADRRTVQRCLARATSPESVAIAMRLVGDLLAKVAKPITVSAVPKSAQELERQREFNVRMSGREASARTAESDSDLTSPLLRGEGYTSSEHSNWPDHAGARAGPALSQSASPVLPEWMQRELELEASRKASEEQLARRRQNKMHQALERLKSKLRGGK